MGLLKFLTYKTCITCGQKFKWLTAMQPTICDTCTVAEKESRRRSYAEYHDRLKQLGRVGFVNLWKEGLKKLGSVEHRTGLSGGISFVGDGDFLVGHERATMVGIWRVPSGEYESTIGESIGHKGYLQSFSVHPSGKLLATGGSDRLVMLWELPTGRHLGTLKGHTKGVQCVQCFGDDLLLTVAFGGNLRIWNLATHESLMSFDLAASASASAFSFSADGKKLAVGTDKGSVEIFDLETGKSLAAPNYFFGPIYSLSLDPSGEWLAVGGFSMVDVLNSSSGLELASVHHAGRVEAMHFSSDGRFLLSVAPMGSKATTNVMDMKTGQSVVSFDSFGEISNGIIGAVFVDEVVLLSLRDGTRILVDFPTATEITRFNHENTPGSSFTAIARLGIIATYGSAQSAWRQETIFWGPP